MYGVNCSGTVAVAAKSEAAAFGTEGEDGGGVSCWGMSGCWPVGGGPVGGRGGSSRRSRRNSSCYGAPQRDNRGMVAFTSMYESSQPDRITSISSLSEVLGLALPECRERGGSRTSNLVGLGTFGVKGQVGGRRISFKNTARNG